MLEQSTVSNRLTHYSLYDKLTLRNKYFRTSHTPIGMGKVDKLQLCELLVRHELGDEAVNQYLKNKKAWEEAEQLCHELWAADQQVWGQ